jgi:preprotein translocase SecF subunit
MRRLALVPADTRIPFMGWRRITLALSVLLTLASLALLFTRGLNFGIDFSGGSLIEITTPAPADLGRLRAALHGLGLGDVQIQEFGTPDDVLIRLEAQPGGEAAQRAAQERVRATLTEVAGSGIEFRRVEMVGPKVGGDLIRASAIAVALSIVAMLIYIWFRFEWPFAVGSVIALVHDVILLLGLFSLLQLEFNLASVAAILLVVGYSMNDTVVVYDRVRENLRKYKRMPLPDLLNQTLNETLSRTTMTSFTTFLAMLGLAVFGGAVIRDFSLALIWGIVIGTYSSIFVAAPVLLWLGVSRGESEAQAGRARARPGA